MFDQPNLAPVDGELYCWRGFYDGEAANDWFQRLRNGLAWQQERLFIYGRCLDVPRLMAWYGDPEARYRYSRVDHLPLSWTDDLLRLREDVEVACHASFNSVLANLYRDGRDSMGCHADDEKELGSEPVIASLSFGGTRLLRFRHRSGIKVDIELANGDLLLMAGVLQHHWRHALPKTRQVKQERINLTFRRILSSNERS